MRLSIHFNDGSVYVDGFCHSGLDMSWVPDFNGIKAHALQWYDDHGEIELVTLDPNIPITELGVFEQAITLWEEKHKEYLDELEKNRLRQEEEKKIAESIIIDEKFDVVDDEQIYYDIEELLKEL